jgi:hypothetical protein
LCRTLRLQHTGDGNPKDPEVVDGRLKTRSSSKSAGKRAGKRATRGEVDVSELVQFTGVFEPLRDPDTFAEVKVDPDLGTVCWPTGADLDPLVLYSKVTGEPIELAKPVLSGP